MRNADFAEQNRPKLFIIHFSSFIIHFMIFAGRGELRSPAGAPRRSPTGENVDFENIKFCSFLRAIRESPLQLMGLMRILVERTYFVGVGAHDDPKNNQ